jgi:hypothetical protein
LPELVDVAHELAAKGVELVTVVVSGRKTMIAEAAQRAGLDAPILIGSSDLDERWRVNLVPWTVIIDRDGKPVEVLRGGQEAATFRERISRHLR